MKVGDYVRTKDDLGVQLICKIEAIYNDFCNTDKGCWDNEHIIKSSPNIIDLIEVGDYVNGVIVTQSYIDNIKHIAPEIKENNYGIKSIVTSEQFSQMEYRIEE